MNQNIWKTAVMTLSARNEAIARNVHNPRATSRFDNLIIDLGNIWMEIMKSHVVYLQEVNNARRT